MKNLFKKNELTQFKIFDEFRKNLKKFYAKLTLSTEKSARNDALTNPPPKEISISSLPEVDKIKNSCSKKLAEISKTTKGHLDSTLTDFSQTDKTLKENNPSEKINGLKSDRRERLGGLEKDYEKRKESLNEDITDKKGELKNHKLDLQDKSKHNLFWPCFFAIFLLVITAGSEVFYTAKAFELTGLSYYEKFLVAIGLGLSTIFIGIGIIEIMRSKWVTIWKIVSTVFMFAIICGTYFMLGKLRVSLLEKEMVSGANFTKLSAFDFLLVNLVFFVAIVLIHWIIFPTKNKFRENREYKTIKKFIKKLEKEIKKFQKERLNLPKELATEQSEVSKKIDDNISEVKRELVDYINKRAENQIIFNNAYGRLMEFYDEINFYYKETIGLYISTMNKYRNDNVFLPMDNSLGNLPNPFKNFEYLIDDNSDNEIEETPKLPEFTDINFDDLLANTNILNNTKNENHEKISIN